MIADEGLADHIDMNFGCPVPKVTRRGGGAALPFKRRLFGQIVAAAVRATEGTDIPVTVKFRIGIDDAHHTHLDAGRIAAEEGAAAVALHARTAAQRYSGTADWEQIAALKQHVTERSGARQRRHLRRRRRAGHDGRHRLRRRRHRPRLPGQAVAVRRAVRRVHRHAPRRHRPRWARSRPSSAGTASCWPPISARTRACATSASTSRGTCTASRPAPTCAGHWRWSRRWPSSTNCSTQLDPDVPFPPAANGPRGRQGSPASVALPEGWLTDPDDCTVPTGADVMHSGGLNRDHSRHYVSQDVSVRYESCRIAAPDAEPTDIAASIRSGSAAADARPARTLLIRSEASRDMSDGDNATPGRPRASDSDGANNGLPDLRCHRQPPRRGSARPFGEPEAARRHRDRRRTVTPTG